MPTSSLSATFAPEADDIRSPGVRRELIRKRYVDVPGASGEAGSGLDPTRFGDWEYAGRCTDF